MTLTFWILFNLFVLSMLALDLLVIHRKDRVMEIKEALLWSGFWVSLAMIFNLMVYYWKGSEAALQFLTAYLIEESLSVDNLFVFLMVFSYFGMPPQYQYKALFWGIIGTLVLRIIFIIAGVALVKAFGFIIYLFGIFLIYAGIRMFMQKEEALNLDDNKILKFVRKNFRVTTGYESGKFFIIRNNKIFATSSFLVLVILVVIDFFFALDSIPAVIAISQDSFIIYTSNVFAIMGLRALYFAISGIMGLFKYLKYGLSAILVFIGIKLLLQDIWHIDTFVALIIIMGILALSVLLSVISPPKE